MVAVIAPAIPEGVAASAALLAALAALLLAVLCLGLLFAWDYTLGFLLRSLASALDIGIPYIFGTLHINLGKYLDELDNSVKGALTKGAQASQQQAGVFWGYTAHLLAWTWHETARMAQAALHFDTWFKEVYLPTYLKGWAHLIHSATSPLTRVVNVTETKVIRLTKTVEVTAKSVAAHTVPDVAIPHVGEWEWITHHWKTLRRLIEGVGALDAPGLITGAWSEIKDILHWRIHTNIRLRRLEELLGAAGMAAVMANALGLPNWRCITRGPLGKVSQALCGLGSTALNDLLGLLVDVLIVEDICQVIVLLEDALSVLETPLQDLVSVVDGALCHGDYQRPPAIGAVALSLPPATGLNLSLV